MDLKAKLLELLGAESSGGWLVFMDELRIQLPFLFLKEDKTGKPGRPMKELIAESYIGEHGFKSWEAMVKHKDGLNWSYDTYKKWRLAYNLVGKHPYLRELDLTYSQINTRNLTKDPEFPASIEEWQEDVKRVKTAQNEKKANSLAAANKANQEMSLNLQVSNSLLKAAQEDVTRLNLNVGIITANTSKYRDKSNELQIKVDELTAENKKLEEYKTRINTYNAKGSLAKLFSSP